jgi:hypothetical protein
MEIIEDNDKDKYWKVENTKLSGHKLYLPECYPLRQIGSYWEDASAFRPEDIDENGEVKKGSKPQLFLEFIRKGEKIPWNLAYRTPGFAGYLVDASYRAEVWDMFSVETAQKGGVDRDEMLKRLGQIDERDNESLIKWLGYAYKGMDPNKRLPTMIITAGERVTLEELSKSIDREGAEDNPFKKEKMYFKWDKKPKFIDRLKRSWRRTFW